MCFMLNLILDFFIDCGGGVAKKEMKTLECVVEGGERIGKFENFLKIIGT